MDLQLDQRELNFFDVVADTTLFAEETLESIVSDACPDILRILDTDGLVCVKSKDVTDGRAEIRGIIRASVLYLPEEGKEICRMEVSLPFSCGLDHSGIKANSDLELMPRLLRGEARMINPRKIFLRMELAVGVRAFSPKTVIVASGCNCEEELGVQEKKDDWQTYIAKTVQSKTFTLSDDVSLPGSKPNLKQMLRQRVSFLCGESRLIGNRLVFKGQGLLDVLYLSEEGTLHTAKFEFPFSQLMEADGGGEEGECDLQLVLNDFSCQADPEEGRTLSVSMNVLAQAVLWEQGRIEGISDLYSTCHPMKLQKKEESLYRLSERAAFRQTVREVLETTVPAKQVADCSVTVGAVSKQWEEGKWKISADTKVKVIFCGEDDEIYSVVRSVPVEYRFPAEEGSECSFRCMESGEVLATPTMGGIEIRFSVDFQYTVKVSQMAGVVCQAQIDREVLRETEGRPSIVLRMVGEEDSLWDIAKACFTTPNDILRANELSDESLPKGQMLLIPRKR